MQQIRKIILLLFFYILIICSHVSGQVPDNIYVYLEAFCHQCDPQHTGSSENQYIYARDIYVISNSEKEISRLISDFKIHLKGTFSNAEQLLPSVRLISANSRSSAKELRETQIKKFQKKEYTISAAGFLPCFASLNPSLDNYLTFLEEFGFQGSVIALERGALLHVNWYGLADPSSHLKQSCTTLYPMGDLIYPLIAQSILILTEYGLLSPDTRLPQIFPDLKPGEKDKISIHHLLTHSSGLPDTDILIPPSQVIQNINDIELKSSPDEEYIPSKLNYYLLASVIEKISGTSAAQFIKEHIIWRYGLNETFFGDQEHSRGYQVISHSPASSLIPVYITPNDLLNWFRSLQRESYFPMIMDEHINNSGYGFQRKGAQWETSSLTNECSSMLLWDPDFNRIIIIMSNSKVNDRRKHLEEIKEDILKILDGYDIRGLSLPLKGGFKEEEEN